MTFINVETKYGTIKGYQENNINFFRGIPYAKTERFKKPSPFYFENGLFDATINEVDCPQHSTYNEPSLKNFYTREFKSNKVYQYDESYMTLNIICPSNKTNLDTVIFIHGGAFVSGCTNDIPYGLSSAYSKKDIILVSVGYRLNVFSSFNSYNLALHDIIYAINWVKENIKLFGGSERITLMGQSAGAFLIQDLLYSNKLKGVISGAVLMSGGGIIPYIFGPSNKNRFKKHFNGYIKSLGISKEEDLIKLPTEVLFKTYESYKPGIFQLMSFMPQVDNDIIKDYPKKLIKRKATLDIPIIFGVTKDDMMPRILLSMAYKHSKYHYINNMSNTYIYLFNRVSGDKSNGVFHASDLFYMFGEMDKAWRSFEEIDYTISEQMIDYISNFIKTGNPNDGELPIWDKVFPNKTIKVFDESLNRSIKYNNVKKMANPKSIFPSIKE